MLKKLKNIMLVIASVATIAVPAMVPSLAYAASDQIGQGLDCGSSFNVNNINGNGSADCPIDASGTGDRLNHILTLVVNIFSLVVGVVAVIMIIVGGLRYITSGGESSNVSTAKNTIIYAIVGLVVVALAQFLVHFVLAKVQQS